MIMFQIIPSKSLPPDTRHGKREKREKGKRGEKTREKRSVGPITDMN